MGTTTTDLTTRTGDRDPGAHLEAKRLRLGQYDVEVGPLGHLAAERQRLAGLRWQHFDAKLCGATIGAVISGLDLRDELAPAVVAELRQALLDYKVVFFRDQPLSAAQHVAFARRFGELEIHPFIPANAEHPELVRFAKSADVGGYENAWHSDVSWRATPSLGAVLRAVEVPPTGGDTLFADMAAICDGLPSELRAQAESLTAVHDFAMAFGHGLDEQGLADMHALHPPVEHPVIRTHPETGRRLVYVNRLFVREIVGLDPDAGRDLIDRLCRDASVPEYQCRFQWEPDSVAFWDNRAVQHYANSDYWPDVRVMERASIIGDRPY